MVEREVVGIEGEVVREVGGGYYARVRVHGEVEEDIGGEDGGWEEDFVERREEGPGGWEGDVLADGEEEEEECLVERGWLATYEVVGGVSGEREGGARTRIVGCLS